MTINEKIAELDKKVEWFYSDEFDLGSAVENYKEAVKLAQEIEKDLTELKNEIEVIDQDFSK